MSKGSTPDYAAAAQATAAGNKDAAIANQIGNMVNQNTPQGNVTYTPQGFSPEELNIFKTTGTLPARYLDKKGNIKTPIQWSQDVTLSPDQQYLYDKSILVDKGLSDLAANQGLDAITNAMDTNLTAGNALQSGVTSREGAFTTSGGNVPLSDSFTPANGEMQYTLDNNSGQIKTDSGANQRAQTGFDNNADQIQSGFDNNADKIKAAFNNNANQIQTSFDNNANQIQTKFDNNANQIQLNSGANQQAQGLRYNNSGQIKTNLGVDPQLLQQQTTDALYKANTQYLDPQFNQAQQKLESQLANQGITKGSEAYNNAMLNFNNQKQQAYESARNQSIGSGVSAAQGMFGMNLQGAQFGNQSLGQQFGQNVTAQQLQNSAAGQNNQLALANQAATNAALSQQFGQNQNAAQFGNQALGQQYNQNLGAAQFGNQALGQQYNQNLGAAQFGNQALGQQYNQNLGAAQFGNQALGQQYNQNLGAAQFGNQGINQNNQLDLANQQAYNQAIAQIFGQGQNSANFQNAAEQQGYNQAMTNAQFGNEAQLAKFNAGIQNAQLNNQVQSQIFGQDLTNAQLNNATSAQQLQQNQAILQNPINIINALRSGAQMQTAQIPQVGVSTPGQLAQWSGPDYLGAAQAQGQASQASANSINSLIGQGINSVGSGVGGFLASDIRLKKNIVKLGIHKTLGIGLYTWDYLWGQKGAGVMAQELQKIMPEAVVKMDDGYLAVNYSMLGV